MSRSPAETHLRAIAQSYGYPVTEEEVGAPEPSGETSTILGREIAQAMGPNSPQFNYAIPAETPLEQIDQGDRVDIYKRGTGERHFQYGVIEKVNLESQEIHIHTEAGNVVINLNDYAPVLVAKAPVGLPGNPIAQDGWTPQS